MGIGILSPEFRRTGTDASGTVVWRWGSDPFGSTPADSDPDGNGVQVILNLRFPGQYYDAETGLHYNYFRDYDPETGRYIESDPLGIRVDLNMYSYVDENPIKFIDPYGLKKVPCPPGIQNCLWMDDGQDNQNAPAECALGEAGCMGRISMLPVKMKSAKQTDCDVCKFSCDLPTTVAPKLGMGKMKIDTGVALNLLCKASRCADVCDGLGQCGNEMPSPVVEIE